MHPKKIQNKFFEYANVQTADHHLITNHKTFINVANR